MRQSELPSRTVRRRALAAVLAALTLLATTAGPILAAEPIDLRDAAPRRTFVPPPKDRHPAPPSPARAANDEPLGHDVSWPQCNDELPAPIGFSVIGVNGGRVYRANPCLADQLAWAGRGADFYINTANPGPDRSQFWPSGQDAPLACDTRTNPGPETRACAYLYGWNAAADSYATALAAYVSLGWADDDAERIPDEATWWLDVETANSWQRDRTLNVAALRGAVDYLESMDVAEVGFYSTPLLWWRVTAGTDAFDDHPAWHAGAHSQREAEDRCAGRSFTGGELRLVQWVEDGIDTNVRCSTIP